MPSQKGFSVLQASVLFVSGSKDVLGGIVDTTANVIVDSASFIKFNGCEFSHLGNVGLGM